MFRMILALTGLFLVSIISAQNCGTPQETLLERVDANKKSLSIYQRSAQKYIPITFHLVANSVGSGRVKEEEVLYLVENLNIAYSDQEALFYIDRFNYFDNDAVYETPASGAARTQMRLREDNNSLNIYITNQAESGSGSPGVTLAYYDPQDDWVVTRKDQVNGARQTLSHEIGHFFSLPHPFSGWDCKPYTEEDYGNPVTRDFTLPCEAGGGSSLIELQNGSNCNIAGDRICDTPPDYNLASQFQNDCDTNTIVMDKNGQLITPLVNNFMSYYINFLCSDYAFTTTQKTLINADFFSVQRLYIRTGVVPATTPVTDDVVYISYINGEMTPGISNILLDWEDTPGANKYMLLLAQNASFTINPKKYFVTASELTIPIDLIAGNLYYWKVWPYNESQTGAGYSAPQNFRVGNGTGINDIKEINDYSLYPNPVNDDRQSILTVTSVKTFDAVMKISDASGHILSSESIVIPAGISQQVIYSTDFPTGVYFVMLHSTSGNLVERLLILE